MAGVAFLFPGQGAQTIGMAKTLVTEYPTAKKLFDCASEILSYDLLEICTQGPKEKLDSTEISQPAIFVSSLAALESLKVNQPEEFNKCTATAGLSLGEYTALTFAGALSFEDGLRIVAARGKAMQAASDATPSGMVSILGLDVSEVGPLVDQAASVGFIKIANYLCPGNTVVSGELAACIEFEKIAEIRRAKTIRLPVSGAFHTHLMKPADEQLKTVLKSCQLNRPRIPVWSNVDAAPHTDVNEIQPLLIQQVLQPVLWETLLRNLFQAGIDCFYEIGPGRVLAGLLKRINRKGDYRNVAA